MGRGFLRAHTSWEGDTTPMLLFGSALLGRGGQEASESVLKNRLMGVSRENAYCPGPRPP